jgi:hypothetical protein
VGINTAGLWAGGMGIAVSTDSIFDRCDKMSFAKDPLKDVRKMKFDPNKNSLEAVRCFYNYLKIRSMEKAFALLSDNFVQGYSFEHWVRGYKPLLDNSLIIIKRDKQVPDRINIKLATKDLIDDEVVSKFFEGYWDVRKVDGRWLLWKPKIREVEDPDDEWFVDQERRKEIVDFAEAHEDFDKYWPKILEMLEQPENEEVSIKELYKRAKK